MIHKHLAYLRPLRLPLAAVRADVVVRAVQAAAAAPEPVAARQLIRDKVRGPEFPLTNAVMKVVYVRTYLWRIQLLKRDFRLLDLVSDNKEERINYVRPTSLFYTSGPRGRFMLVFMELQLRGRRGRRRCRSWQRGRVNSELRFEGLNSH